MAALVCSPALPTLASQVTIYGWSTREGVGDATLCSSRVETIGLIRWWILLAQATPFAATHVIGLLRYYGFGARGDPLAGPLPRDPPQSGWIAAIDEALDRDVAMDKVFRDHSQRSWFFARALAAAKGHALDDETLYAACLLHDAGLFDEDARPASPWSGPTWSARQPQRPESTPTRPRPRPSPWRPTSTYDHKRSWRGIEGPGHCST